MRNQHIPGRRTYPKRIEERQRSFHLFLLHTALKLSNYHYDPDSDNDGLYDGLERGYKPGDVSIGTDLSRGYFVPDPDHETTDPFDLDSDDDNLNDGTEDTNHNGRIDGDNGDGIYQTTEFWTETNPNEGDTDSDEISDYWEKQYGYSPIKADTDGDTISDSDEDTDKDGILDSGETDPSKFDTDGDGLSDKTETDGWTICIIREATGEEINHYTVSSNPREVHSDTDTLTDYQEFQNCTDPTEDDTDGDGKNDYEELTYDFSSSPTGIDGQAPTISYFDCSYEGSDEVGLGKLKIPTKLKLIISITVKDIFGLDKMSIHIDHLEDNTTYIGGLTSYSNTNEWTISGFDKIKKAVWDGFKINVTVYDVNSNFGWKEQKQDGIAKLIVEAMIGDIVNRINIISELVSLSYSWIIKHINDFMNQIVIPIGENLFNYIRGAYKSFDELVYSFIDLFTGEGVSSSLILSTFLIFINSIFYPVIDLIMVLIDIIDAVMKLLEGLKDFMEKYFYDLLENAYYSIYSTIFKIFNIEPPHILAKFSVALATGGLPLFIIDQISPFLFKPISNTVAKYAEDISNDVGSYKTDPDGGKPSVEGSDSEESDLGFLSDICCYYLCCKSLISIVTLFYDIYFWISELKNLKALHTYEQTISNPSKINSNMENNIIKFDKSLSKEGLVNRWKFQSNVKFFKPGFGIAISLVTLYFWMYSSIYSGMRFFTKLIIGGIGILGSLMGLGLEILFGTKKTAIIPAVNLVLTSILASLEIGIRYGCFDYFKSDDYEKYTP